MMTKSLIKEYLDLFSKFNGTPFSLEEASNLIQKPKGTMRHEIYRIKRELGLISEDRARYRLVGPSKWLGLTYTLTRFPEMEEFYRTILPVLDSVNALFLIGSRARGDYYTDSDYDFLALVEDKKTKEYLDKVTQRIKKVQIEAYETSKIEKKYELDPLYLISGLRESITIFGDSLKRYLLSWKIDRAALGAGLKIGLGRLDEVRELLDDELDRSLISTVVYTTFLRWRQAYLVKCILEDEKPEFIREFSKYHTDKHRLRELYMFYRIVRDTPPDKIPKEVPETTKEELKELIDLVKDYVGDTIKMLGA